MPRVRGPFFTDKQAAVASVTEIKLVSLIVNIMNGDVIESWAYFLKKSVFAVFPNPFLKFQSVAAHAREDRTLFGCHFEIMNSLGVPRSLGLVIRKSLKGLLSLVSLSLCF